MGQVGVDTLKHRFARAYDMLRIGLEQLFHLYPQCLCPVDVIREFGSNPRPGMYFDKYNFVPLSAVFDQETISTYQGRLQGHDLVKTAMRFYGSRPELSEQQIQETRTDDEGVVSKVEKLNDFTASWFCMKAQMRATSMPLTYVDPLSPHC